MLIPAIVAVALLGPQSPSQAALPIEDTVAHMRNAFAKAKGISLEIHRQSSKGKLYFKVKAARPNLYRIDGEDESYYCDGKQIYKYFPKHNSYTRFEPWRLGRGLPVTGGFALYAADESFKPTFDRTATVQFQGKKALALVQEFKQYGITVTLYVDPDSYLPVGEVRKNPNDTFTTTFDHLKTDESFTLEEFKWTPPPAAHLLHIDNRPLSKG